MPTSTWVALANYTIAGSADAEIVFSNIPATYRDLVLIANGSPDDTQYPSLVLRLNSDSGNNYSYVRMSGNGATGSSGAAANQNVMPVSSAAGLGPATTSRFALVCHLLDYSATDKHKTVVARNDVPGTAVEMSASRWASTAAVTSISVLTNTTTKYAIGSTFSLFGIVS
jgi:hypothetical protein